MEILKELSEIAEKWKIIPGLESYAINEDGVVKALPKVREGRLDCLNSHECCTKKSQRKYKEHLIKQRFTSRYWYVCLMHNGIKKDYRVHRLVYLAFVGPIPDGMVIDHIDGNRNNNNINNLRCVTPSENTRNPATRFNNRRPVLQLDPETKEVIAEFPSPKAADLALGAEDIPGKSSKISNCCRGERRTAWGFMWQYKDDYNQGNIRIKPSFYKPVIQYDLLNNYIADYPTVKAAAEALHINVSGIHRCASGKTSKYKEYIWKYKNT